MLLSQIDNEQRVERKVFLSESRVVKSGEEWGVVRGPRPK
jgi:hypothetical protein